MLKVKHNAGFFSCCTIRLFDIIRYFYANRTLPKIVDSCEQYELYKKNQNVDVTFDFFEHYDNKYINISCKSIDICLIFGLAIQTSYFQFFNYKHIDYQLINSFVEKYFSPSSTIVNIRNELQMKYNIDVNNCVAVYFRGTDKITETQIDSFESYYNQIEKIVSNEKNLQILIQTDTSQFIDYIKSKNLNNLILINENATSYESTGIHYEKSPEQNYADIKTLFATFLLISKCKYIICSSGNCSVWIMYFRQNAIGVYQNLNTEWL